jgi:hypothetical protein
MFVVKLIYDQGIFNTSMMTIALTTNGSIAGFVMSYPCEKQIFKISFEQFFKLVTFWPVVNLKKSIQVMMNKVLADILKFKLSSMVFKPTLDF